MGLGVGKPANAEAGVGVGIFFLRRNRARSSLRRFFRSGSSECGA